MKGAAFALLCAVALARAELNQNGCPTNPYIDVLVPHPNCNKFYQCVQGDLFERKCASNLVFNVEIQECDWPENVDCENRTPIAPVSSEEDKSEESGNVNDDPSLAPEICAAEDSDGILVAHEKCNKFYQCYNGVPVAFACAPLILVFNPRTEACDWPENVDCGNRIPGGNGDGGNGDGGNGDGDNNSVSNSSEDGGDSGNGDSGNGGGDNNSVSKSNEDSGDSGNGNGNDDPSLAGKICAAEGSEGVLVAHEICNKFYICNNGVPVARRCAPVDLVFNPSIGECDWPENVDCSNRVPGGDGDGGNGDGGNGDSGNGDGDNNSISNSSEDSGDSGNGNGNDDPSLAGKICAAEGSEGVLVAHDICNKFYICNNGVPVARRCAPVDLVFNPSIGECDWPENVDCDNRIPGGDGDGGNGDGGNGDGGNGDGGNGDGDNNSVSNSSEEGGDSGNGDSGNGGGDNNSVSNSNEDSGDSGNGNGNDDPSLAGKICAAEGSEGVLVAHEICNKFYICNNGVPVARRCAPVDLVFNPSIGECDWPENVDCSNRVPGGDGDGGNGDGGNGDSGNGDGDNNSISNSSEDSGDSGNGNGNDDPSLAGKICATEGSEGVLVAHEICNKFYICNNGVPVARRCAPVDLVFNPSIGECDWPDNVNCGNRVPGGDGNGGNGDGGNGDGGNGDGGNGDGDNNSVSNSSEDGGDSGNGDSGNGGGDNNSVSNSNEDSGDSGNGHGNDDPSLAGKICATEGSEGVLVAHEICNKFYICNNGVPVARRCAPVDLVFNPSIGECDWPENVDCGNRVPGGDGDGGNGDGGTGDSGNGDSGNGEGDNNSVSNSNEDSSDSGNGNGNDDPSLAGKICAAEGSEGVLVAHEICNKFYICNNGVPVALRCAPVDLVFNPSIGECDWPENVDCGNRVPGGDGDGGNGDGGNGDSGNGGGDNNSVSNSNEDSGDSGNGHGNDDPSLAGKICATEGSEGVLVAHEICNKFYICNNGVPVARRCAPVDLVFNPSIGECDWPENVDCGNRVPGGDGDGGNGDGGTGDSGNGDSGNGEGDNNSVSNSNEDSSDSGNGNGNDDPSLAGKICAAEGSEGVLVAHEICNKFYICNNGVPVARRCAPVDLVFNPNIGECDWPENVDCSNRVPGGDGDGGNGDGGNGDGGNGDGGNGDSGNGEGDNNSVSNSNEDSGDSGNGNGNDDPSLAGKICAAEGSEGVLVAHEICNKFYICNNGVPVARKCAPVDLVFNPSIGECDWPGNVDCGNRVPGGDGDGGNGDGGNGDSGNGEGDNNSVSNSNEDSGDSGNGNGNDDPSLAGKICAAEGSEGVLVAHEICNKFYICNNGVPVARRCAPVDLVFNPSIGECDWPGNVDCSNRVPGGDGDGGNGDGGNGDGGNGDGGNGDSGNGEGDNNSVSNSNEDSGDSGNGNGNDDPSLAGKICAAEGSEGVLVAHEICNKFYICNNGVPVARKCAPVDLVFNPSIGECDWPGNVDCGNRVPGGDGDGGNGDGGNGDSGNGEGDNNSVSNSNEDSGDSGNGNGNDDPSLAGKICAAEGSEGVLVAHEICNKFYICNNGVPVARRCAPVDLVFNPNIGECDWPENVDCSNRVPGGDGDGGNGDGGNGGGGNGDSGNGEGDNNSVSNSNEDSGDSGNGNGNDDPSLAGKICAAEGSEGVLVAHEICNKFYICNNGVPVARRCAPVDLVFNPNIGECDWPENVDCSNRVPGGDGDGGNGDGGNGDGGNGDSGNGNGDNNGVSNSSEDSGDSGNGNGNYDPSLAGKICAAEGSEGVLVAHEICNKFYICNNGVPVARRCAPVDLVFNPSIGECDWPENVDCGNRVPGGDGDGGNGDGGNGDGGNGDNSEGSNSSEDDSGNGDGDNGNNDGGGNANHGDAAEICAADDSDGVLVAHENCNQFYTCSGGKPVVLTCYGNLHFNPNIDECDWPENVNCGVRNPDGGNGNNDNGNGDVRNGDGGNGDGHNGSNGGDGIDNHIKAPEICAADGSDGVLVAHENCNQYYKCSEGKLVAFTCQLNLLFNPSNDQCDWPENVDCGDRNPDGDNGNGSSGNSNEDSGDNDSGNSNEDAGKGDGGGDNSNVGGGNGDPSLAPAICAADDSDDVLVAHENCSQFYVCSGGKPVVLDCPPLLVFNPATDECNWPSDVDCGTRYSFTSFNKHLRRLIEQFRAQ